MKDTHNDYTPEQLEQIITTVHERCGKATLKLVGERIGRGTTYVWHRLNAAGLPTRLLNSSLRAIEAKISKEAPTSTLAELFDRHGSLWANPHSFASFLVKRKITYLRATFNKKTSYLSVTSRAELFGREGLLNDTVKTDIEIKRALELDALKIDNDPTKLHKDSWDKVKHKLT